MARTGDGSPLKPQLDLRHRKWKERQEILGCLLQQTDLLPKASVCPRAEVRADTDIQGTARCYRSETLWLESGEHSRNV